MPTIYGYTDIQGNLLVSGITASQLKLTSGASSGYILQSDASGNTTWTQLPGGLTGSGTTNYVPRWTNSNTLSSTGSIYDNGSQVGIGVTSFTTGAKLEVKNISDGGIGGFLYAGYFQNTGSASTKKGIFVSSTGDGISTSSTGIEITTSGANVANYGVNSSLVGSYGLNNYSGYFTNTSTGTTNYGIYIDSFGAASVNYGIVVNRGTSVFNESGGNYDFRVEGDTDTNLLFIDASNDNIGIGTNTISVGSKLNILNNSTNTTKFGIYSNVSGNGLSSTNYGIYTSVSGANSTNYGSYIQISGTYSTFSYGSYVELLNSSTSTQYGNYILVNGTNSLVNYGQYMSVNLGSNSGYGNYINIQGDSTGSYTGHYLNIAQNTGTNSQSNYGSVINMLGDGSFNTGLFSTSKYGSLSNFGVWAAVGTNVGYTVGDIALYAWVSDDAQLTSYPSEAGRFENRSKSSQNYGISVYNTSTYSTTNTGLYIRSDSATVTNNAIVAETGNSIFNESGGDYDFRIEGDTDVNLFFADASTDRIGIGNNNPSYKLQVSGTVSSTNAFNVNGLNGWSGTFSADGQIVTVTGGIITGVV